MDMSESRMCWVIGSLTPFEVNFYECEIWSKVSKAFDQSRIQAGGICFLSQALHVKLNPETKARSVK